MEPLPPPRRPGRTSPTGSSQLPSPWGSPALNAPAKLCTSFNCQGPGLPAASCSASSSSRGCRCPGGQRAPRRLVEQVHPGAMASAQVRDGARAGTGAGATVCAKVHLPPGKVVIAGAGPIRSRTGCLSPLPPPSLTPQVFEPHPAPSQSPVCKMRVNRGHSSGVPLGTKELRSGRALRRVFHT